MLFLLKSIFFLEKHGLIFVFTIGRELLSFFVTYLGKGKYLSFDSFLQIHSLNIFSQHSLQTQIFKLQR